MVQLSSPQVEKNTAKRKILFLTIGVAFFVLIANLGLGVFLQDRSSGVSKITPTPTVVVQEAIDTFSYKGIDGKDALMILKEKTSVEQNNSGLVTTINKRKADDKKREFWAFYVNGKMASVGPAEYQTQDTDKLEWKIEKY